MWVQAPLHTIITTFFKFFSKNIKLVLKKNKTVPSKYVQLITLNPRYVIQCFYPHDANCDISQNLITQKILQKTKRNIAKKENNKGITIQTLKAEAGIIIQFH